MTATAGQSLRTDPWPSGAALLEDIARAKPAHGSLALWHIGQSGFFVKGGGLTLLFDPFLSPSGERLKRTWEPPVSPQDMSAINVDVVLCTHDHGDHLDRFTVGGISRASPHTLFVVPDAAAYRLTELEISDTRRLHAPVHEVIAHNGMTIRSVPAAHGDGAKPIAECVWEPDSERGYRFTGYIVTLNGVTLYHAGDTVMYPGMVDLLAPLEIDIALIPINGRDWFREQRQIIGNTDHREAADLGHAIGAGVVVPMHYDMFAGNPGFPGWFVDYCTSQYPGQSFQVPARCRRWTYVK